MGTSHVFLGVSSSVLCVDANTGESIWKTEISRGFGDGFVSLALHHEKVFAHSRGKLYCLDRTTGAILWTNDLKGMGFGTAFVCTDSTPMHYVDSLLKRENAKSSGG